MNSKQFFSIIIFQKSIDLSTYPVTKSREGLHLIVKRNNKTIRYSMKEK